MFSCRFEIIALLIMRQYILGRSNVRPIDRFIEIDRRLVVDIECTAQSRKDLLDRGITRLNCDGLRATANLDFGEHWSRSNCYGNAEDSPKAAIREADGPYPHDCSPRQFQSPPA